MSEKQLLLARVFGGCSVFSVAMVGIVYGGIRYARRRALEAGYTQLALELLNDYPHTERLLGCPVQPGRIVIFGDREKFNSWTQKSGLRRLKLPVHGFHSSGLLYIWARKTDLGEPDDSYTDIWKIERLDLALPNIAPDCKWTFYNTNGLRECELNAE